MVRFAAIVAGLSMAACSPVGAAQDAPPAPVSEAASPELSEAGMMLINVTVISGSERHSFKTEVAATQAQQTKGMMFRTEMGDDEGMIFPSYQAQPRGFWMKNTPLPLDIIFIGPDNRITNIGSGVPYSTQSVYSDGPALAVFEIRGGLSEELGIEAGDVVEWELPEGAAL